MIEQVQPVQKRLTNAMRQLRQEMEASGEKMPDCGFVVSVRDGKVEISENIPTPDDPPLRDKKRRGE
jgi:hypothetical protein